MVKRADPGDAGRLETTHVGDRALKICAGVLPEVCSRHNTPSRAWAIPGLVRAGANRGDVDIVLGVDEPSHAFAAVCAVARALPTFSLASKKVQRSVRLLVQSPGGVISDIGPLQAGADAVRMAADLTDQPPTTLGVNALVAIAQSVARDQPTVRIKVFQGTELIEEGLGGIWGVGKAAEQPPALVILDHVIAEGAPPGEAWVGKGIVYDTGGLSIKSKTGMPGMKTDMAGAAAVLAAFDAAVKLGCRQRLTAVLCIAENAVGPGATRPDDVLHMYSGKTVEVNNTDAEGRLVLADGVAWVARNRSPARIIDMATLTGAQSVATGKRMAALFCTDDNLEAAAVRAGRASGDTCHPLPYVPEFHRREFHSDVADMRNSVKDRGNAQSSCAAQFIGNHLDGVGFGGPWLHIDMAGPSHSGGRGTGYGVALLMTLVGLGAPL
jgi:probable aminopeptidase NPEPL1